MAAGKALYNTRTLCAALATAICTMSAVLADVDDLDNYCFRYDFSSGDRVYYGSDAYSTDPLKSGTDIVALPVTGPNGANTAVHPDSGGGWTEAYTQFGTDLNNDWTFAMSVRTGPTEKGVIFSIGRRGHTYNKGISICSSSDTSKLIVDENIRGGSTTSSQRQSIALDNGVDVSAGFHTIVAVHKKAASGNAGTVDFWVDGVPQKQLKTDNKAFGTGFQFCYTYSGLLGNEVETLPDLNFAFRDLRFYSTAFSDGDAKKYAALYPADKMRPSAAVRAYGVNYVNTEYRVQPSTRIVADFQFTGWAEKYQDRIFGNDSNSGGIICFFYIAGGGKFARCLHDHGAGWGDFGVAANTRRGLVSLDSPNDSAKLYQDGVETTKTLDGSASNTGTIPLALFAQRQPDGTVIDNSKSLIYSVGLQENGTPVHFFAPATNELGAAGFKDVITGNFKGEGEETPSTALAYFDGVGCADDYKYEGGTLYAKCYAYSADASMGGVKFGTESAAASTSAWIAYGGEATLTATQVWGYKFTGWTGDTWAIKSGSASDATITVSCDRAAQLQANYIRCAGMMIIVY